jgi:hypothetical protein
LIQELLYTSHEGRGLRQGGGGGFCTVLSTEGMASNLAAALEKLSGYKHPFDIHDSRSQQNPVNFRHAIIRVGGKSYHVLSRIADLRGEHTGRSNKLAHHVVLSQSDVVQGGPTRLLRHAGFCRERWDGKVELVHAVPNSSIPNDDMSPTICQHWQSVGGDAGLAGHVADQLLLRPNPAISIIFPLGADTLSLADEVFSVLPRSKRWVVTFSTYYASAPPISSCHLRFVLDGTSDAEQLRRDHRQTVIDLINPPTISVISDRVAAARSGKRDVLLSSEESSRSVATETSKKAWERDAAELRLEPLVDHSSLEMEYSISPPISKGRTFPRKMEGERGRPVRNASANRQSITKWLIGLCCGGLVVVLALTLTYFVYGLNKSINYESEGERRVVSAPPLAGQDAVKSVVVPNNELSGNDSVEIRKEPKQVDPSELSEEEKPAASLVNVSPHASVNTTDGEKPAAVENAVKPESDPTISKDKPESARGIRPTPILPIPVFAISSPTNQIVTEPIEQKLNAPNGQLTEIALVGFEWIGQEWKKLDSGKELEFRGNPSAGTAKLIRKASGLDSETVLCHWLYDDGVLTFRWSKDSLKQVETTRRKAGVLNGLRWCAIRLSTGNIHEYVRMSAPAGQAIRSGLVPPEQKTGLVSGTLPTALIRSKLDLSNPANYAGSPEQFPSDGTPRQSLTLYRDRSGNDVSSVLDFHDNGSYEWQLDITTTVTLATSADENRKRSVNSPEELQVVIGKLDGEIAGMDEQINQRSVVLKSLPDLPKDEKRAVRRNELERDLDALKAKRSDVMGLKEKLSFSNGSYEVRIEYQLEYADSGRIVVIPIFADEKDPANQPAVAELYK